MKIVILIISVLLRPDLGFGAPPRIYVPNRGDTGWQTYVYTAGSRGFTGTVGFVVSNVIDNSAYSELLLDNLRGGGGTNLSFETGNLREYTLVDELPQMSFANVSDLVTAYSYTAYSATDGTYFADLQGLYLPNLHWGVTTSQFHNASGQPGTVGSILETAITLAPGEKFSFDWAFLGNDCSPYNDFVLVYLKDPQSGAIVFQELLAQISSPTVPIEAILLLLDVGSF